MPNPNVWGPLLGVLLLFSIVGPGFAGLTLLFTKHPRTRYFWVFAVVYAGLAAWWLVGLITPEKVFAQVFHFVPDATIEGLTYEIDRQPDNGVLLFRFRTSPETITRMRRMRALQPAAPPDVADLVPTGLEVPDGWPPAWAAEAEAFHIEIGGTDYRSLAEWLLFEPKSGEAIYVMVGARNR